jgi:hypothetical protein
MVQPFNCCVALVALEAFWALIPAEAFLERLTVLRRIFKYLGRAAEISHVMCINAALTVMAVFLSWTPRRFVKEHIEYEAVLIQVERLQVVV